MVTIKSKYKLLYTSKKRYFIVTGGRGSGKTYAVQDCLIRLLEEVGQGILYTRYTMTSVEKTIIPLFVKHIEKITDPRNYHITKTMIINKRTKSFIMFSGIKTSSGDQTAKLKTLPDICTWVIEEGEDYNKENSFLDIDDSIRQDHIQNRIIWIQNPTTREHFIYQKFFEGYTQHREIDGVKYQHSIHPNVEHIHTTYLDNIENLDPLKVQQWRDTKKTNPDLYANKYIGAWRDKAEGVIYTNWEIGDFPDNVPYIYGLDFGVVDPDALVKVAIDTKNNIIYAKECLYQNNLSTGELYEILNNECGRRLIIGDAAAKRQILDFRRKNLNIRKCYKPKVVERIKLVKGFKLVVSGNNLVKELNNYHWLDKAGEYPVDNYNHILDALGYAVVELCKKRLGTM